MKRLMMIAAALVLLALPTAAIAEETVIPPEVSWSETPPARVVVDAEQLMKLLVKKGVITPIEQAQLTQRGAAVSTTDYREMDRNNGVEYASQP
jgi:hypothetical protein